MVPLERRTVRFIDNFSGGNRGASSAEYFIEHGYAVLFLYRKNSLQPFNRHLLLKTELGDFLNYLELVPSHQSCTCNNNNNNLDHINNNNNNNSNSVYHSLPSHNQVSVQVKGDFNQKVAEHLQNYSKAKAEEKLYLETFITIHEYLWLLKDTSLSLRPLKANAMIYAAAAVSDFYIPISSMAENKIQSSGTGLSLVLDPVPKCLGLLCSEWIPQGFVISFKLETDPSILTCKISRSLSSYGQHVVVGNLLSTYKDTVVVHFSSLLSSPPITLHRPDHSFDLEETLIPLLISAHSKFINSFL